MALLGGRGKGKSLVGCAIALEYHCAGHPVWFNPRNYLTFGTPVDLVEIIESDETQFRGGLLVIDEVHMSFNKYRSSSRAAILLSRLVTQIRKRGLDFLYMTNSLGETSEFLRYQTDFHARLTPYLPPHGDSVIVQWTDTQGRYGRANQSYGKLKQSELFGGFDFRKRMVEVLHPASAYYPYFNTFAEVGTELLDLDSDTLKARQAAKSDEAVLGRALRSYLVGQYVPWAVQEGYVSINPVLLAGFLNDEPAQRSSWSGGPVDEDTVRKALAAVGLKRRAGAYLVPSSVEVWRMGAA